MASKKKETRGHILKTKSSRCFSCKKEVSEFEILYSLPLFWKGICPECVKHKKILGWEREVKRAIKRYKEGTGLKVLTSLEALSEFKRQTIKKETIYLDKLERLKVKGNKDSILEHLKLGVKDKIIARYCKGCYTYSLFHENNIFLKSSDRNGKYLCRVCFNKRINFYRKDKKVDPKKSREYRLMWENTMVLDEASDKLITRLAKKDLDRYRRNIKSSIKDKRKLRALLKTINEIESDLNIQIDVDHIIPLKGKFVSGLNHYDNIQLLEKSINIRKGNRMIYKDGASFYDLIKINSLDYFGNTKYTSLTFDEYLEECNRSEQQMEQTYNKIFKI